MHLLQCECTRRGLGFSILKFTPTCTKYNENEVNKTDDGEEK